MYSLYVILCLLRYVYPVFILLDVFVHFAKATFDCVCYFVFYHVFSLGFSSLVLSVQYLAK